MLSRRQFLTSAAFPVALEAGGIPCGALAAQGEPTVQRLETRVLEVNGKPAKVYGIRQPNGTGMMTTLIYLQAVRLANTAFRLRHCPQPLDHPAVRRCFFGAPANRRAASPAQARTRFSQYRAM